MWNELALLTSRRRLRARRALKEAGWAQWAVIALFLLLGLLISVGSYSVYYHYFQRLLFDQLGGPLIARYVLEASFALVFFLGVISFVVSATGLLYRSREVRLLLTLPLSPWKIFLHRFIGASLLAAWPVIFLGLPAIFALGAVLQAGIGFYIASLITLMLFTEFIAVVGGLISFLLSWLAGKLSSGWVWALESAASIFLLLWLIGRIIPRSLFSMFYVASADQADLVISRLNSIFTPIPSHHFVDLISLSLPFSQLSASPLSIAMKLTLILVSAFALMTLLAWRFYLPTWRALEEGGFAARPEDAPPVNAYRRPFPRLCRHRYSYLFEKEWLLLGRDAEALSRGGFILFLLFLYLAVAATMSRLAIFSTPENFAMLTAFVFAVIGYFALTLCMRFVFPSVSAEGSASTTLWSSPLHRHELFSWKLFFWVTVLTLPLLLAVGLTAFMFSLPLGLWLYLAYAAICTAVALVVMTLGQGSASPRFREPNADTLATSPSGLAAVAIGLGYLYVAGGYVRQYTLFWLERQQADLNAVFGLLIVTLGLLVLYWTLAPRRLEKMELT